MDSRPEAQALRTMVMDELRRVFVMSQADASGFSLERAGRVVRVHMSAEQTKDYIERIEERAYEAMGVEPRWRSSISLTVVHILEEAAMAESGMSVVIDGDVIRRDPSPG